VATQRNRADEQVEVALLLRRAGISLSEAEQAALVEPYQRNRAALDALRAELSLAEEPAVTFEP
jgi:hypothetical protein